MAQSSSLNLRSTVFIGIVVGCFCFFIFSLLDVVESLQKCQSQVGPTEGITKCQEDIMAILFDPQRNWREGSFKSAIIAGLIAAIHSYIGNLYDNLKADTQEIVQDSRKLFERCISLIDIHNKSQGNPWLHKTLEDIVIVNEATHYDKVLSRFVRSQIDEGIHESQKIFKGQRWDSKGSEAETKRRRQLLDIINHSVTQINAVTSTDPTYLETFWQRDHFSQAYLQANLDAASRGVLIQRIFVLPETILSGADERGIQAIKTIIEPMLGKSENLQIYYVPEKNLSPFLATQGNQNFMIVDKLFTSMSFREKVDEESSGYLTIAMSSEISRMSDIFYSLFERAQPANTFQIFS
jgi:hypothetical protein